MALFDDLLISLPLTLGMVATSFVVFNVYFKQAFRRETRLNAIETLIKQLGIKDFHPKDLNSDKLDDKGFARLLGLISTLYATQSGSPYGANAAVSQANAVIQQMQQMQEQQLRIQQMQRDAKGQPTTP